MAAFNDATPNFGFPKPHPKNPMSEDCVRLASALDGVDSELATFQAILARYQAELIRVANRISGLETGGCSGSGGEGGMAALPFNGVELPGGATLSPVTIVKEGALAPEGAALVVKFGQGS